MTPWIRFARVNIPLSTRLLVFHFTEYMTNTTCWVAAYEYIIQIIGFGYSGCVHHLHHEFCLTATVTTFTV